MKISLIIPAYNEEKYIGDCLESVKKYGQGLFEVIVVNNASTDNTRKIIESFPEFKIVDEMQKGLPFARGRGQKEAMGDFVAYIDADCKLYPKWFGKIENFFQKNPKIIALSGPYKYYDLNFFENILAQIGWWSASPLAYKIVGYAMVGGNCVIKKDIMDKIGGFSLDVAFYGDDADLPRRLSPYGKVMFSMDFFVYSSGRRMKKDGIIWTFTIYGLNFLWEVLFKKPFSSSYENIR